MGDGVPAGRRPPITERSGTLHLRDADSGERVEVGGTPTVTDSGQSGLGDVLPVSAPARVLTMLEQFAGVGYIATVVSRLIGLTIVRHERG